MKALINDSGPFWLVLDTGMPGLLLSEEASKKLALKLDQQVQLPFVNSPEETCRVAELVSVRVGGYTSQGIEPAVCPTDQFAMADGRRIDGFLGTDFIKRYVLQIDYRAKRIRLGLPEQFEYSGHGDILPLRFIYDKPLASIGIRREDKVLEFPFLIDTGSPYTFLGSDAATLAGPILARQETDSLFPFGTTNRRVLPRIWVRPEGLIFEKTVIVDPLVTLMTRTANTIGTDILSRFTVILDYSQDRIILEPNSSLGAPFNTDTSGVRLFAKGDDFKTFQVWGVVEASPAAEAGIQLGDIIRSINRSKASQLNLERLKGLLSTPGQKIKLTVERDGKLISIEFRTKPLEWAIPAARQR